MTFAQKKEERRKSSAYGNSFSRCMLAKEGLLSCRKGMTMTVTIQDLNYIHVTAPEAIPYTILCVLAISFSNTSGGRDK